MKFGRCIAIVRENFYRYCYQRLYKWGNDWITNGTSTLITSEFIGK